MTKTKSFLAAACGLMLLTLALWGTNRVKATQPQAEYTSFGMVGVARGQTLRLNVVNARIFALLGPLLSLDIHFAVGNFSLDDSFVEDLGLD